MKKIFTLIAMLVCSVAMFAADYTDTLRVSLNGVALPNTVTSFSFDKQEDGKYTVSLKNFTFSSPTGNITIGTVVLKDCENKSTEEGVVSISVTSVKATVIDGDDKNVLWIGPIMLGGSVTVDKGEFYVANGKAFASMTMNIPNVGTVDCVFGSDPRSAGMATINATGNTPASYFSVDGKRLSVPGNGVTIIKQGNVTKKVVIE